MKKIYFFLLFLATNLAAQVQPNVPDFLISGTDNTPSTLDQMTPVLTKVNSDNFIVAWYDRRDGSSYYAQKYDLNGNKIGKNLKVDGPFAYLGISNSLLTLHTTSTTFFDDAWYTIHAKLFNSENNLLQNTVIDEGFLPWCGTGYIPGEELVSASANSFYYLSNEGGTLRLAKIQNDGSVKHFENPFIANYITRVAITAGSNNTAYAWLKGANEWDTDSLGTGIFLTVINSEDSVIVPSLLIKKIEGNLDIWGSYLANYRLNIIQTGNSLYKIFWAGSNETKLYSASVNIDNNTVYDLDSLVLSGESDYWSLSNFILTNTADDGFYLKLRYTAYDGDYEELQYLIKYDISGQKSGDVLSKTGPINVCSNEFYSGSGILYSVSSEKGDIFLIKKNCLDSVSAQLINDDMEGSEEKNYSITGGNENFILSTWNDGRNFYGNTIDKNGSLGAEMLLKEGDYKYFSDGKILATWIRKTEDKSNAGYTIYDNSFKEILSKSLAESASQYDILITAEILSDTTFTIVYGVTGSYTLSKVGVSGSALKTLQLPFSQKLYKSKIHKDDEGFIWVQGNSGFIKYNYDLEKLKEIALEYYYTVNYLGKDRFLTTITIGNWSFDRKIAGNIFTSEKDTLVKGIIFGDYPPESMEYFIENLNNDRFIYIYKSNGNYFGRTYNIEGKAFPTTFKINTSSNNEISNIKSLQKGNKVYFTWSEAKTPGRSFDIYGSIFDVDKITSMEGAVTDRPTSYRLEQNYPNPFNPSTSFSYHVSEPGLVTIKLYDLLGTEISTLVNEEKSAGVHKVSFDGSNLASGTYFYRIIVNSFTETRKMMLVK